MAEPRPEPQKLHRTGRGRHACVEHAGIVDQYTIRDSTPATVLRDE